ncbi:MAG: lysophospholipid acyltransferase family protein [Actinomycetota bacterium]
MKRPSLAKDLRAMARGWRWGRRPLVPRSVEPLHVEPRDFPTEWARGRRAQAARAAIQQYALKPLLNVETETHVEGLDVLDTIVPPAIFVANHSSHLDAPLVLTSLPPAWRARTATGAAADYFFDVWWRAAATALVFNAFPVERAGSKGRTTRLAKDLLEDGWSILVFPEGTRSKDGWVRALRLGAARLAVDNRVPVVPVALRGTYHAMPRGSAWIAKGRPPVHVRFGRPLFPQEHEAAHDFNTRIKRALAVTLNEDGQTWWESLKAAAREQTPSIGGPPAARWRRTWEASRPLPKKRSAFPR